MTEDAARERVRMLVGAEGYRRLGELVELVIEENQRQNLIARSTIATIWTRHVLDSVQLLQWAGSASGRWLDIGTGGGFPGLAVAAATDQFPITLVEPRRRRAAFLSAAARHLGRSNVTIIATRVEAIHHDAIIISARAVAPVEKLLQEAGHCATSATRWLLLRGRMGADEATALKQRYRTMMFHVEQSLSDPDSSIVIATGEGRQA